MYKVIYKHAAQCASDKFFGKTVFVRLTTMHSTLYSCSTLLDIYLYIATMYMYVANINCQTRSNHELQL